MEHRRHFALLADYNQWANQRLIAGLALLPDVDWHADHGLFFHSVHLTLNHNLVVEQLWLARLAGEPWRGRSLTDAQDATRSGLIEKLGTQNARTHAAMLSLPDPLPERIRYTTTDGAAMDVPLAPILAHVFNHATHHRGQITAVAHRLGLRVQELDIPYFLADARL